MITMLNVSELKIKLINVNATVFIIKSNIGVSPVLLFGKVSV